jgi:hypothetical protein
MYTVSALTRVPQFGHAFTQEWTGAFRILKKWLYVIGSSNNFNWSRKHSSRAFIWGTTQYGSFDFKNWPAVHILTSALTCTMKGTADRPKNLISWVVDHMLLAHQVWSWSNQKYLKNKVFVIISVYPNFDLDPGQLVSWLPSPWH